MTYSYDDTDQVTADGHTTVTYDANGNRNNGSYTVGTGNRLLSHSTWNFTYDDEGNLTKKSKGATQETWTYQYDQRNQLTSVKRSQTDGGAVDLQVDFKYDASGNRIEKSYDADGAGAGAATITRFALDMWKNLSQHLVGNENVDVWADHTSGGSLTTRYLRGDIVDQIFARQDAGTQYWYLNDHLGSIRDVVNNSAVVKDSIQYNAFGEIISETDAIYRGRYAWTGREFDTEINLQYNRARYYDAKTGRWISQDPVGFDAGDSNLYRYVNNSPVIRRDPSGFQFNLLHSATGTWVVNGSDTGLKVASNTAADAISFFESWVVVKKVIVDYSGGAIDEVHAGIDHVNGDIKGRFIVDGSTTAGIGGQIQLPKNSLANDPRHIGVAFELTDTKKNSNLVPGWKRMWLQFVYVERNDRHNIKVKIGSMGNWRLDGTPFPTASNRIDFPGIGVPVSLATKSKFFVLERRASFAVAIASVSEDFKFIKRELCSTMEFSSDLLLWQDVGHSILRMNHSYGGIKGSAWDFLRAGDNWIKIQQQTAPALSVID